MDNITISREKMRAQYLDILRNEKTQEDAFMLHRAARHYGQLSIGLGGEIGELHKALDSAMAAAWQDYMAEDLH